jgi:hypothetical protein
VDVISLGMAAEMTPSSPGPRIAPPFSPRLIPGDNCPFWATLISPERTSPAPQDPPASFATAIPTA